jgi:hypothetical protein
MLQHPPAAATTHLAISEKEKKPSASIGSELPNVAPPLLSFVRGMYHQLPLPSALQGVGVVVGVGGCGCGCGCGCE